MPPKHAPPTHDPDVWLFDLDNTLYPARCNLFAQIDVRIGRYISDWLKVDAEEARRVQKQYWREHGTSMRGMMTLHGVDPDALSSITCTTSTTRRSRPTRRSRRRSSALPGRKIIFTAGDVPHAERVMERLGVAHHFEAIFDIAAGDYWPKPHHADLRQAGAQARRRSDARLHGRRHRRQPQARRRHGHAHGVDPHRREREARGRPRSRATSTIRPTISRPGSPSGSPKGTSRSEDPDSGRRRRRRLLGRAPAPGRHRRHFPAAREARRAGARATGWW